MLVRTWRFITLLFVALTLSMSFCHSLEMPVINVSWRCFGAFQMATTRRSSAASRVLSMISVTRKHSSAVSSGLAPL